MTTTSPRDLVVGVYDEPDLIVAGVQTMLRRAGTAGAVRPVSDHGPRARVDVVLCDPLRDPSVDDEEVGAYLARVRHLVAAPVVAFSWSTRPDRVRVALQSGASAFVAKQARAQEVARVLAQVHAGLADPSAAGPGPEAVVLSDRETAVLQLICQGLSNDEIADALFVSVNSVKTWIRQVYRKTGVTRRAQAVAWGIAHDY